MSLSTETAVRELELKSRVSDLGLLIARLLEVGAELRYQGRLEDRRYDTPDLLLRSRHEMLRTRTAWDARGVVGELTWKGPTRVVDGYKARDEMCLAQGHPTDLQEALASDGFVVARAIDRDVREYLLQGAMVRTESYPRMDDLVEVEGEPEAIERAITQLGLPRADFQVRGIPHFAAAFTERTGITPAIADTDLPDGVRSALRSHHGSVLGGRGWTLTDEWHRIPRPVALRLTAVRQGPRPVAPHVTRRR